MNGLPSFKKKHTHKIFLNKKIVSNIRQKRFKIMSVENSVRTSDNLFGFEQKEIGSETDNTLILEEIIRDDTDSTDGRFDFLRSLSDQV